MSVERTLKFKLLKPTAFFIAVANILIKKNFRKILIQTYIVYKDENSSTNPFVNIQLSARASTVIIQTPLNQACSFALLS